MTTVLTAPIAPLTAAVGLASPPARAGPAEANHAKVQEVWKDMRRTGGYGNPLTGLVDQISNFLAGDNWPAAKPQPVRSENSN